MASYTIKDLELISGIKAHTIRIWEKRYGIIKPDRTDTNFRRYSDEDLKRLLNISILNRHGIRISLIAGLSDNQLIEKVASFTQETSGIDNQIESLVVSMLELDEAKFEKIISSAVLKNGFEETIIRIIYPFFDRIGTLWQIGAVNPAQEHFVTSLVRQKLIVAIDGTIDKNPDPKRFLLFLPEGELHEIGLLFLHYIIRKHGHEVVYMGQSVPYKDVLEAGKIKPPQYILTSFTCSFNQIDIETYVENLVADFQGTTILVTGYQLLQQNIRLPKDVILLKKATDLYPVIQSI